MKGIIDSVGLKHLKRQQLVGRRRRERFVLIGGQGAQAVPGLRGHVCGHCSDVEVGVVQHLGRGVGVALIQIRQHNLLARADAPGDCLTERDYARSCPGATIGEGLAVRGEEVRDAGPDIQSWLRRTRLR